MSFDLAVWPEPAVITAEEAARKYAEFAAREPAAVPADPRALAFHRELTARYPSLRDLPVEELENSPWNGDPVVLGEAVLITMSWSTADAAVLFVWELAERHMLVLFDPQGPTVYSPPMLRRDSMSVLAACDGTRVENPDAAQIEAVLGRLSAKNWFAVLERGDHYVQVGVGERAATRSPWLALEHREGLPDRHFRVQVADPARIVRAFTGFAAGDGGWRDGFDWQRVAY
ncbi:hypothetical protein Amsp01_047260 [Amycolatopsis sp. NBRC 101858]|uniref:hypothetical protein n=1 Tax=Amycolatopsis sp. NBRC 101858 TaxID=3032200 RepID=UPI0024A00843|nr:hypothetical protein [Amycolatopsis sp. NBRC 101858]GLY38702.1 hypothetical protein Amsp01_047260 [Amycolatopsis sp. NBRC 101858]